MIMWCFYLGKLKLILLVLFVLDLIMILSLAITPPRKKITIAGSSTLFPLAQRWADIYMQANPNVSVEVTGGGSGLGILAAGKHTVDIGMSSHPLEPEQRLEFPSLVEIPVALDAVAIVVNKNVNETLRLSRDMLVAIFSGQVETWEDLAERFNITIRARGEIIVCVRADKSGTTDVFSKWLSLSEKWTLGHGEVISWPRSPRFISGNGNQEVLINVRTNPNAIGYVGLAYAQGGENVVVASILNPSTGKYVLPTPETVKMAASLNVSMANATLFDPPILGAYPITRSLYFVVDRDYVRKKQHVVAFLRWILDSQGGQEESIVRGVGYVELTDTRLHEIGLAIVASLSP